MAIWAHLQLLNCRVKSCQQSVADRHATSDFNHFNDFTFPVAMNDKKNHQIKIRWNYNLLGPLLAKEAKSIDLKANIYMQTDINLLKKMAHELNVFHHLNGFTYKTCILVSYETSLENVHELIQLSFWAENNWSFCDFESVDCSQFQRKVPTKCRTAPML